LHLTSNFFEAFTLRWRRRLSSHMPSFWLSYPKAFLFTIYKFLTMGWFDRLAEAVSELWYGPSSTPSDNLERQDPSDNVRPRLILTRRSSMYVDPDGDAAHAFYEERSGRLARVTQNLRHVGEVPHPIPRLNRNLTTVIQSTRAATSSRLDSEGAARAAISKRGWSGSIDSDGRGPRKGPSLGSASFGAGTGSSGPSVSVQGGPKRSEKAEKKLKGKKKNVRRG